MSSSSIPRVASSFSTVVPQEKHAAGYPAKYRHWWACWRSQWTSWKIKSRKTTFIEPGLGDQSLVVKKKRKEEEEDCGKRPIIRACTCRRSPSLFPSPSFAKLQQRPSVPRSTLHRLAYRLRLPFFLTFFLFFLFFILCIISPSSILFVSSLKYQHMHTYLY